MPSPSPSRWAGGSGAVLSESLLESGTYAPYEPSRVESPRESPQWRGVGPAFGAFGLCFVAACVVTMGYWALGAQSIPVTLAIPALPESERALADSNLQLSLVAAACHHEAQAPAPYKYAVSLVTPVQLQLLRGACWLFAMTAVLEHSYRKQAVAAGYLPADSYLRLSEQALGAVMTRACAANAAVCKTGDDNLAYTGHSTEGGEPEWLYYLQNKVGDKAALPWSVCPYIKSPTSDDKCEGYEAAHSVSPLSFSISSLQTYYGHEDIKSALRSTGRAMAMSLALFGQTYRLPCTAATAAQLQCDPHGPMCVQCPLETNFRNVECCIEQSRLGTNMRGEFSGGLPLGSPLAAVGGHAVTIVGYTDTFASSMGHVGGFIIKNSWWDGVPPHSLLCDDVTAPCVAGRGSHSVAYFMQQISDIVEREVCPNAASPSSWYACVDLATCTDELTAISAAAMRKVLRLQCLEDGARSPYVKNICSEGEFFFFKNSTVFGGGLSRACMVRADGGADLCLPPLRLEDLALLFAPTPAEARENDHDRCGFYLLPYAVSHELMATIGGTYVTDLDIRWNGGSFAGAPESERLADADYSMLRRDTFAQLETNAAGPFPSLVHPI